MPFIYDKASGLFVSSSGSSVRALNVDKRDRTAVIVQNYTGHNADVNDLLVTFHMLFSCSDEVICHNFGTGREKWRLLKEVGQPIAKLSFLGDTLVVCMADCSVAMINIRRGTLLYYVELKGERVGGLPFIGIDEFNRMAYVQGNRCVNGWSLAVGRRVFNTDLVVGQIYSSTHSSIYKLVYGGAGDGAVRAYKVPTGETLWTALGHTENVNALIASEHLEVVMSGSADGTVRAWDIRNGTPRWSAIVFPDKLSITGAACAEYEALLVVAGEDGTLVALDANEGLQKWRTLSQAFPYTSLAIVTSNSLGAGFMQHFAGGYMLLTEDEGGAIAVRNIFTGRVMWSWDPCVVTAEQLSVIALPRAPSLGRARFGGIRAVAGLYNNGTIRMVDANDGSTLWRTSGGGGAAVSMAMDRVNEDGVIIYGTDTGSVLALDELTGRRFWKVAGFGGAVIHIVVGRIFTLLADKSVVKVQALFTWSDDNILRCWNLVTGERLWSRHDVDATVAVLHSLGCPYVICVGIHHMTTVAVESGQVVTVARDVGDEENPVVVASMSPRVQFSAHMRSSGRKLSSRGSKGSASVHPFDEEPQDEDKPIEVVTVGQTEADVPALDFSSLPASPSPQRGSNRVVLVACVLQNGDVFVVNAEDADIPCAVSIPWAEEGDGSVGHIRPANQKPKVTLYDGVGIVGASRKPLVIAGLGSGFNAFLAAWRVFDDNRIAWDVPIPNEGATELRCVGKWLYSCGTHGVTLIDPVNGRTVWKYHAGREFLSSSSFLITTADPKPRRRGGWHVGSETLEGIVFGSTAGGMFAFSTEDRSSKVGAVTFLQVGASHGLDLYQDEIPTHPKYHPPGSGGLSGLLRTAYDTKSWGVHKWLLTSSSQWHEIKNVVDFSVEAFLWLLVMLQLSYFPLRAKFPALMNAWKSLATALATFNISSMDGSDPFQPAYQTCVFLFLAMWLVATSQVWIMEWRLRHPLSWFRNAVCAAVFGFARVSYMMLYIPIIRMLIAPFICNVAIQTVAWQMMFSQNFYLDAGSPKTYKVILPAPTAVSMGRDLLCRGGTYFSFFSISIILLLLYIPLICRLIGVRGDITLMRYSSRFRSAIGWWRDDDSTSAMDVVKGRNHGFAVKNRFVAVMFLVIQRMILVALSEALLPPAAEFFFVAVVTSLILTIQVFRPMFHDKLANVLMKSASAVIVLLSWLAWFSSVWVRPIGPRGEARDGFVNFLVVVGSPAVFLCLLMEEQIRHKVGPYLKKWFCGSSHHEREKAYRRGNAGSQRSLLDSRASSRMDTTETEATAPFTS